MAGRISFVPAETLPSRKVLPLLSRSSRYVRIYLGEVDVDWRNYTVPRWTVILAKSKKKQPADWQCSGFDRTIVDWEGRLIGSEGFLDGPYEQFQFPDPIDPSLLSSLQIHESYLKFDPMPSDKKKDLKSALEWKHRFCNPHTFLGQTQQAAVDYFLNDGIEIQPPQYIDPTASCPFLSTIVDNYPIFCSLIEVCEMDSLVLLMSTCRYVRRRILETPSFWKEINITAYVSNRKEKLLRDYRFDTVSEIAPGRAGKWSGSPIHILSGLKKPHPTLHWLHRSVLNNEERILSSLPLAYLTKLTLDGSDIYRGCWWHIQETVMKQLTYLSVRWCRGFTLLTIIYDVLGEYLEEARQRVPLRIVPDRPCKLKTLLVWGLRGEMNPPGRVSEPRERDIQILTDNAGSSRFCINGTGVKALYIQYCAALGIKTDFGACSATMKCCWNDHYIKENNFDYGGVDAGLPLHPSIEDGVPLLAAPGYLAARSCSRCGEIKETHLCRECEEARSCYICLRYICMECDRSMAFATRPLDWRDVRTRYHIPEGMPKKYCVSNCCNSCVDAGRYVCAECNLCSKAETRRLLLNNCSGCTCNYMPEDFCPIRIPIDSQMDRHGRKHLTVCGVKDCGNLIVACNKCENGKAVMDNGQRCSACAIPVCWTCARTPCPYCPIAYDRLCPRCVVEHTCTCYHTARRTVKRKKGGRKKNGDQVEDEGAKPSSRKTHQPGCPLRPIQIHAETPLTTTLRYHDRYVLPGGEIRSERSFQDPDGNHILFYPKVKLEPACDDCGIAWWTQPRYEEEKLGKIRPRRNIR